MRYKKKTTKYYRIKKTINKYKGKTIKGYNKEDIIKKGRQQTVLYKRYNRESIIYGII